MKRITRLTLGYLGLSWMAMASAMTLCATPTSAMPSPAASIRVTLAPGLVTAPISGRLLVMFAPLDTGAQDDVRLDLSPTTDAIAFFGQTVTDWRRGHTLTLSPQAVGFPYPSLAALPAGRYRIQASFERYQSYRRADGQALLLPMIEPVGAPPDTHIEPRRWHSVAEDILWDGRQTPGSLVLSVPVTDTATFRDSPWVKSFRLRSQRLSDFWGRDIYLGALVTLPVGYHDHPHTRYPWLIRLGGLPRTPTHWREQPPDTHISQHSAEWREQQAGWDNFQYWLSPSVPRMVLVELQHPTPYADSSLATNSLNNGPYADAIRHELLPAIEQAFRVEAAGWARVLFGIADGGWSALSLQIHYPQHFNGVWASCPDPVDFRHFGLVDLQQDRNALFVDGPHLRVPRAAHRDLTGLTVALLTDVSRWESALADHSRSREMLDRWEAAFSLVDVTGYPQALWHRLTGVIDDDVAEHWYQHHDLLGLIQRQPPETLEALRGKIRLRIGGRDAYFFDNAVRSFAESLGSTRTALDLSIDLGSSAAECWTGRHDLPADEARWRHMQDVLPWAFERVMQAAPVGSASAPWRYSRQ